MMQDQEEQQQDNGQQQDAADGAVRFPAWTALAILSVVAWAALLGRKHNMDSSEKWAFAVTTLSWILAVIGWLCYLKARGVFMNQPPEVMLVRTNRMIVLSCPILFLFIIFLSFP